MKKTLLMFALLTLLSGCATRSDGVNYGETAANAFAEGFRPTWDWTLDSFRVIGAGAGRAMR